MHVGTGGDSVYLNNGCFHGFRHIIFPLITSYFSGVSMFAQYELHFFCGKYLPYAKRKLRGLLFKIKERLNVS